MGVGEGRTDVPKGVIDLGESASPDDVERFNRIWRRAARELHDSRGPDLWAFFFAGFWILLGIAVALIVTGAPSDRVLLVEAAALFLVFLGLRVHKSVRND